MRKICILAALVLALTVTISGAAECLMPGEICGCWHGEDGGVLLILPDRRAIVARDGISMRGSYTLDGGWLYLDDLHPPAWEHGVKWAYAVCDNVLILWDGAETLIYTKGGVYHGEN